MNEKARDRKLNIVMIGAHPDDCEFFGGATAALWAEQGHNVRFVACSCGDAGHHEIGGGPLALKRRQESAGSSGILGVTSQILEYHDGELLPTLDFRRDLIRIIRNCQADIVISHRPNDYHPDHRYASQTVQDAAYLVVVPNMCPETPALEKNPAFFYFHDQFKKPYPFSPDVIVDSTPAMDKKLDALDAMDSQMYEWLPWVERYDKPIPDDREGRKEFIKTFFADFLRSPADNHRALLEERYGADRAGKIEFAEAFELCEYGSQPARDEIWEIFPY